MVPLIINPIYTLYHVGIYWVSWILSIQIPCRKRSHIPPFTGKAGTSSTQKCRLGWDMWSFPGEYTYLGVSKNNGTPKSSILIGFSLINRPFGGTTIFGNTHLLAVGRVPYTNSFTSHTMVMPCLGFPRRSIRQFPCLVVEYRLGSIESRRISKLQIRWYWYWNVLFFSILSTKNTTVVQFFCFLLLQHVAKWKMCRYCGGFIFESLL